VKLMLNKIMKSDRYDKAFVFVLIFFIVFQVIYFCFVQSHYPGIGFGSENYYSPLAENLVKHGEYSFGEIPDLKPSNYRPPLYSIALAIIYSVFGVNEVWGLILNNILLSSLVFIVYKIGCIFSKKVGIFATIVFIVDPILLKTANTNQSDMLFVFLLSLFVFFAIRVVNNGLSQKIIVISSLMLGLATFTRALGMYIWILTILTLLIVNWRKVNRLTLLKYITIFVFIQALFIGGWMFRNYHITGNSAYAGMKSTHLFSFYAPRIMGKVKNVDWLKVKAQMAADIKKDEKYSSLLTETERFNYRMQIAKQIIIDNWQYAILVVIDNIPQFFLSYPVDAMLVLYDQAKFEKISRFLNGPRSYNEKSIKAKINVFRTYFQNDVGLVMVHGIAIKGFYLIIAVCSFIGIGQMLLNSKYRPIGLFVCFLSIYLILVSCISVQGRFRIPLMPFWSVSAAYCIHNLYNHLKKKSEY
jgi:hypothetical protein